MDIKAIFFDIDGTLVSFKTHKILESTKESLRLLKEKGIKIFIATGRSKDGLELLNDIEFDGYITLNGQYCFNKDKIIYENFLLKDDLKILLDELKKDPFPCGFTMPDGKIYNYKDNRVKEIHSITHNDDQDVGDISNVLDKKVYQLMAFVNDEKEKALLNKMRNSISARWHPLFCDITPKGGTKKLGISKFLKYYNIPLDQTMAFGDGGNDLEMFEYVKYGIAMENGDDKLKEIAHFVTKSVDDDGISYALKKLNIL